MYADDDRDSARRGGLDDILAQNSDLHDWNVVILVAKVGSISYMWLSAQSTVVALLLC